MEHRDCMGVALLELAGMLLMMALIRQMILTDIAIYNRNQILQMYLIVGNAHNTTPDSIPVSVYELTCCG